MKQRFRKYLSTPLSKYLALVFLGISASAAAVQIFGDVQSISGSDGGDDDASVVLDAAFSEPFSEILSQSRFGGQCNYTGFSSPRGPERFPSEQRWRFEQSDEDVAFQYSCAEGSYLINLSVDNLQLSEPGRVTISGTIQGSDADVLQVRFFGVNQESEICWDKSVDFAIEKGSLSTSFEGAVQVSESEGWSLDCYLVRPSQVYLVSSATSIAVDPESSRLIDAKLRENVPADCYFIAALLTTGEVKGELGSLHEYINANYMSKDRNFGLSGPSSQGYEFDPALSIKLPLFPDWVYTCEPDGQLREFYFGGMDWPKKGFYQKAPQKNEINIFYRSWSENLVEVSFSIEFFDANLNSCGVRSFSLETTDEGWDGWHVLDLPQTLIPDLDRHLCQIISLKEYEENIP